MAFPHTPPGPILLRSVARRILRYFSGSVLDHVNVTSRRPPTTLCYICPYSVKTRPIAVLRPKSNTTRRALIGRVNSWREEVRSIVTRPYSFLHCVEAAVPRRIDASCSRSITSSQFLSRQLDKHAFQIGQPLCPCTACTATCVASTNVLIFNGSLSEQQVLEESVANALLAFCVPLCSAQCGCHESFRALSPSKPANALESIRRARICVPSAELVRSPFLLSL